MMDLTTVQADVLALSPASDLEQIGAAIDLFAAVKQRVKELDALLTQQLTGIVMENGEFTIGTVCYCLGTKKTTKCKDVPGAAQALLEAAGGDWDLFCEHLSAQSIKYGAAKQLLGDRWGEYFVVDVEEVLEEGKPKKELQKLDTRFLR